ncbi:NRDE-2, necessary for RNA interference-domain-containing protein, partial [Rhodocollybia butyracea]
MNPQPPSFTSFPIFDSFPDTEPGPSQPQKLERSQKKIKSSKDSSRKRSKYNADAPLRQKDEEPTTFYYSDRKADPLNITYGKPYHGDVPKYTSGRKILGLSLAYTAFARTDKGIEVGLYRRNQVTLDDRSKASKLLSTAPRRMLSADGNSTKYPEVDGFLRLPSRQGRRSRDDDPSYRSISRNEADSDSESESVASSSEDEHIRLPSQQESLRQLEQQLTVDPSSITNWINLLSRTLSATIPKTRHKTAVAVLSKAISAHPANSTSVPLRIKYLKAGENVWDKDACRSEWEDALRLGSIDIWMEWFEWKIAQTDEDLDQVINAALRILSSLDDSEDAEVGRVRVFWRTAIAFQQAGYHERAIAMFQAQAELTFEIPQGLHGLSLDTRVGELESFWDSEVPRMGEPNAMGWAHWLSVKQKQPDPVAIERSSVVTPKTTELDPYRQWAESEVQADRAGRLPIRSTSNEIDSDPYAMILFADIRPLLLNLQTQRAKNAFRLAWLSTLGLHLPGFSTSLSTSGEGWDDRWSYTFLTQPTFLDAVLPSSDSPPVSLTADASAGALVSPQKTYKKSFGPMKNWSWGSLRFFDPVFGSTGIWERLDIADVDSAFVSRIFSSLRLGPGDVEWDLLSLAFGAAANVKGALKLSRSFLSTARDSLPHWAAHAQLERMRGKLDDARKVYQTVLIASAESAPRSGESFLWWDWAEMEWLTGQLESALSVILRAAKVEGRGGVAILRAKRALNDSRNECYPWQEKEAWIKLTALLDLLVSHNIPNALSVFEQELNGIKPRQTAHESLTMARLVFIYQYGFVLKNPMSPSILRERVLKAMVHYPHNSVVFALFLEVEKGQGIWGRIRGTLGDSEENMKDVARRVQEVWIAGWESGRWEAEIERTRIGMSTAVEHERTKGSSQLWRIYIEFEMRAKQYKNAKSLLYRAIGQCPHSKELYLLAFGPLRSVFEGSELKRLAEAMAERGIRLRKGLDEVLEEWGPEVERMDEVDNSEEDSEIEYNAKELQRLRPY